MSYIKKCPDWIKNTPGQYGSNGINSNGSLMNINNRLGKRSSIRLFPSRNSGLTMKHLISGNNNSDEAEIWPEKLVDVQKNLWKYASEGNTIEVKRAIQNGADPLLGDPTNFNWIAMHYTASKNRYLTTKYLLSLKSGDEQRLCLNKFGKTPEELSASSRIVRLFKK